MTASVGVVNTILTNHSSCEGTSGTKCEASLMTPHSLETSSQSLQSEHPKLGIAEPGTTGMTE